MANKPKDITGVVIGRLTAISRTNEKLKGGNYKWLFRCECGNTVVRSAKIVSHQNVGANGCGCRTWKTANHDYYKTHKKLTWVHIAMKQRCFNSSCKDYPNYGGRGITVCDEWLDLKTFCDWAVSTGYKEGLTIERINVDGDYCPDNCSWIVNDFQPRNRTISIIYEHNGLKGDARFWSEYSGINYNTLRNRLNNYGWSIEKALTKPIGRWAK
ncbi:hypothetical protein [Acinetobacter phage HFM1]|nr:hypothetical protein [Acinetobacter phage HFM1]